MRLISPLIPIFTPMEPILTMASAKSVAKLAFELPLVTKYESIICFMLLSWYRTESDRMTPLPSLMLLNIWSSNTNWLSQSKGILTLTSPPWGHFDLSTWKNTGFIVGSFASKRGLTKKHAVVPIVCAPVNRNKVLINKGCLYLIKLSRLIRIISYQH